MSRLFGEMRQVGVVVRDLDATIRHWVDVCGVGPWFHTDRLAFSTFTYRGRRYDDIHVSAAFANSGDVQIELLQQRCSTPSMYRDFLAAGREGVQHWSSWPENYRELYDRAVAAGYEVGQEGTSNRGPFVYFLREGHAGSVIEMAEMTPARSRIFGIIRDAARGWDGSNPVRPMPT
jgi:catechol 2,3-dioxygenase-like lactoylglutathione lyase family enzyme